MAVTETNAVASISQRESRRAFALNVINGGLFGFADTLMDTNLVLVWFLSQLTDSNLLLGALGPIASGGWFLPQLFLSGWIQSRPRKIVVYRIATLIRCFTWGMLALTMWLVRDPLWLLLLFFPVYTVMRLAAGLGGIPFLEVMAKTIPARWRGRLFALRFLVGGVLGLLGTRIVRWVLDSSLPYPSNYALLVFGALLIGSMGMFAFTLTREPPGNIQPRVSLKTQIQRGVAAFRNNVDYRNLLLGRGFLLFGTMAIPFYTVLARRVLHAPEHVVGDYLLVLILTKLLVNYPWGWIADTKGLRWVIRAAALGSMLTALLGLAVFGAVQQGLFDALPFPLHWLAYLFFVMVGIFTPADGITGMNMLLRIAPEENRALYLGFANSFLGVIVLLSGFGGALVDSFGLGVLFLGSVIMSSFAFVFLGRVRSV